MQKKQLYRDKKGRFASVGNLTNTGSGSSPSPSFNPNPSPSFEVPSFEVTRDTETLTEKSMLDTYKGVMERLSNNETSGNNGEVIMEDVDSVNVLLNNLKSFSRKKTNHIPYSKNKHLYNEILDFCNKRNPSKIVTSFSEVPLDVIRDFFEWDLTSLQNALNEADTKAVNTNTTNNNPLKEVKAQDAEQKKLNSAIALIKIALSLLED